MYLVYSQIRLNLLGNYHQFGYVTKRGKKRKKRKPCSDSVEIKNFRSKKCENSPQKKVKEKHWAHSLD